MYNFGLVLVGIIWGTTDCYLEQGVINDTKERTFVQKLLTPSIYLPMLINYVGSILFYFILGKASTFSFS